MTGVTSGADPQTLFVNDAGLISTYSLVTGATEDAVEGSGAVGPLAWDAVTNRLYSLGGASENPLLSIDPATKTVVDLFDTELAGAADLAFDAANQRVLVLRDTLFSVSLADGAVSELSPLPPATVGIEVGTDGALARAVRDRRRRGRVARPGLSLDRELARARGLLQRYRSLRLARVRRVLGDARRRDFRHPGGIELPGPRR